MNTSGGLLCIWANNFITEVEVQIGDRWICVKGWVVDIKIHTAIVLVYGPHVAIEKRKMWDEILELRTNMGVPMIVMGDFNEIRCPEERRGCLTMSRSMSNFDEWINNLGLIDMPIIGRKFTWRRGRSCSRLDRILVDPLWLEKENSWKVKCQNFSVSDHTSLLLEAEAVDWGPKPFRSFDIWLSHPGFRKLINDEWRKCGEVTLHEKLKKK